MFLILSSSSYLKTTCRRDIPIYAPHRPRPKFKPRHLPPHRHSPDHPQGTSHLVRRGNPGNPRQDAAGTRARAPGLSGRWRTNDPTPAQSLSTGFLHVCAYPLLTAELWRERHGGGHDEAGALYMEMERWVTISDSARRPEPLALRWSSLSQPGFQQRRLRSEPARVDL